MRHVANAEGSLQDCHALISALLEELKDIQDTGLEWNWLWTGPDFEDQDVLLVLRIFVVKGDSLGHDKILSADTVTVHLQKWTPWISP